MNKKFLLSFLLALLLVPLGLQAQNIMVTGKVISSDDGLGLPGVNVTVKGVSGGRASWLLGHIKKWMRFLWYLDVLENKRCQALSDSSFSPPEDPIQDVFIMGAQEVCGE